MKFDGKRLSGATHRRRPSPFVVRAAAVFPDTEVRVFPPSALDRYFRDYRGGVRSSGGLAAGRVLGPAEAEAIGVPAGMGGDSSGGALISIVAGGRSAHQRRAANMINRAIVQALRRIMVLTETLKQLMRVKSEAPRLEPTN